jgi:hypothetical protein
MSTNGLFRLSSLTILLLAVLAIAMLAAAIWLYFANKALVGGAIHLVSLGLVGFILLNLWTSVDFMSLDVALTGFALIGSVVVPAFWIWVAYLFVGHHEHEDVQESHG